MYPRYTLQYSPQHYQSSSQKIFARKIDSVEVSIVLASFPGPAQLFVACSTEKRGEPGIFSHVSMM